MKKIVLILVFLLAGSFIYCQNFYAFGEFIYYPMFETKDIIPSGVDFSTSIGIGFEFRGLYVEVEQKVNIVKCDFIYFKPYKEKYYVRIGFVIWAIGLEFEHLCTHNIDWSGSFYQYNKFGINFDTRRLNNK